MIKSVTVTNYLGDSLKMTLTRPDISGFVISNIEGLGPVAANINTTKVATIHGSMFNSSQLSERNITMSLIFYDDGTRTMEEIRHISYKYFPIGRYVHLTFDTDSRVLETDGYVETNEPTIFSNQEGTALSIICPDPFFYSPRYEDTDFGLIVPSFEFPFGTVDNLTDFTIGEISDSTETTVRYEGDYEVGIAISMNFLGDTGSVYINNITTNETMVIDATKLPTILNSDPKFVNGDIVNINTKSRNKSITLIRDGKTHNLLNCLARGTKWFVLSKGDNVFSFNADLNNIKDEGTKNVRLYIKNKIIYDGV